MAISQIVAVFTAIVIVAGVFVVVGSPNTSKIIQAVGSMFSGGLRAAMGK